MSTYRKGRFTLSLAHVGPNKPRIYTENVVLHSGNEIQMPVSKTNAATAKLWTTSAKDTNTAIDDYDFSLMPVNLAVPPSRPTGLFFSNGNGTITLNWTTNSESNLKGYYVFQNGTRSSIISGNSYTVPFSQNGANRFYVSAVEKIGQ